MEEFTPSVGQQDWASSLEERVCIYYSSPALRTRLEKGRSILEGGQIGRTYGRYPHCSLWPFLCLTFPVCLGKRGKCRKHPFMRNFFVRKRLSWKCSFLGNRSKRLLFYRKELICTSLFMGGCSPRVHCMCHGSISHVIEQENLC